MCMPWEKYAFSLYRVIDGKKKTRHQVGIEKPCTNYALPGSQVCADHIRRDPTKKNQATFDFDHGLIGGPYTVSSRLYGSPAYLNLIKEGWLIEPSDEERAKAAQEKARSEPMAPRKSKKTADPSISTETVATVSSIIQVPVPQEPEPTKKVARKVRVSKKALAEVTPSEVPQVKAVDIPQLLESMTTPIVPFEVVKVKVKKVRLEGKDYYLAPSTGKVYTIGSHGMPDKYRGRYLVTEDSTKLDTAYPDSDVEVD